MARDMFTSDFVERPFWWDDAPPTDSDAAELPDRADVVVVGGGYTGLNAARRLAQEGASVVVLEAEQLGWGASTRNAGHLSSGVNLGKGSSSGVRSPLERSLTPELLSALREEARDAFGYLESLIADNDLNCQYVRSGRFVGAISGRHFRTLKSKIEAADLGDSRIVPPGEQHHEIATTAYAGGAVIGLAGQLHPAHFYHGVLSLATKHGARVFGRTPVSRIERRTGQSGFLVHAGGRRIAADHVLLATNGYTGPLDSWLRRRIVPAASYIIVTEPLPEGQLETLIPNFRTVADTRRLLTYFRPTPDRRRILFGGRAILTTKPASEIAGHLYRRLVTIFPGLDGVRISHAWTGKIAFTFDFLPHMGSHEGVTYCAGCNGSGVAMQSYLGYRAAESLLGRPSSGFWNLEFPTVPFYRGTPWFLPLMTANYAFRDWIDRLR